LNHAGIAESMRFKDLIGNAGLRKSLLTAFRAGRTHSTYLFLGKDGIGKWTTARALVAAAWCEQPDENGDCGQCPSCVKLAQDVHPELRLVDATERIIKIDQIRELTEWLWLKGFSTGRRILLVDAAERMNPQSQNCFLKTLEEPPPGAVIILISANPGALLPTIRSRCQKVRFLPPTHAEVMPLLVAGGFHAEAGQALLQAADGSIRTLLRLLEDKQYFAFRREVVRRLAEPGDFFETGKWFAEQKEVLPEVFTLISSLLHDLMGLPYGSQPAAVDPEERTALTALAQRLHGRRMLEVLDEFVELRKRSATNCNLQLCFERFLLALV